MATRTLYHSVIAARERFVRAGIPPDQAAIDAEVLARHATGWDRATYLTRRDTESTHEIDFAYERVVVRREQREPVAYITGHREFWGLDFLVSPAVLIPRPETEFIVEAAIARMGDRKRRCEVADVGTGSGCLAVSLAVEFPHAHVTATDVSDQALALARTNSERLGVSDRVTFVRTSMLDAAHGPFDLVVANPPYVPRSQQSTLSPDVRDHEPDVALYGTGDDGLDLVRTLLAQVPSRLTPDGLLLMEFGFGQGDRVRAAAATVAGIETLDVLRDLQRHERTLVARKRG